MTDSYDHSDSGRSASVSHARLARLISVYGANPRRWPGNHGKMQPTDLSMNAELRAQLEAEAALDEALDSLPAIEIPDRLHQRLTARFDRFKEEKEERISQRIARLGASLRELVWPGASWWQPTFALSLSVLVGLSAGLVLPYSLADFGDQQTSGLSDTPTAVDIDQGQY